MKNALKKNTSKKKSVDKKKNSQWNKQEDFELIEPTTWDSDLFPQEAILRVMLLLLQALDQPKENNHSNESFN